MRFATLALIFALCAPVTSVAATATGPGSTSYEVEVIVFANRDQGLNGGELWTRDRVKPIDVDMSQAITVADAPADSALAEAAKRIVGDGRYQILVHKRWVQNPEAKSTSQMVRLNDGAELDGFLRFYLSRFLHVEMNLAMTKPAGGGLFSAPSDMDQLYRLTQQRRVKSQEINYFDHPLFGALVRVAPTEQR